MPIPDLSILVNAAEVMKNHFKSFQRIEEILKAIQSSEGYLSELTVKQNAAIATNAKLIAERDELQKKIDTLKAALKDFQPSVEATLAEARNKLDMDLANANAEGVKKISKAKADADAVILDIRSKADQEVRICQSRINDAQAEASEADTMSRNIIMDWEAKIKAQEARYQEVTDRLAKIKQSL